MKPRLAVAALIAGLAFAAASARAQTLTDKLGDLTVSLPIPAGFAPVEGAAAVLRGILVRAMPPAYRLIAVEVPQDYLDNLHAHAAAGSLPRYVTILTYRNYETSGMPPELFAAAKTAMRDQGDQVMKLAQAQVGDVVDKVSKDIAKATGDPTATLKVGAIATLGVFDEQPDSVALAMIGPVSVSSREVNETRDQVAVVAIVLIHGKPINANFYSNYASKDDLEWAKDQARDWIRRVKALNP